MIDSKELRKGNTVMHPAEGILQIGTLKHKTATCFNSDRDFRHVRYEDLVGISLSPEWFEMLGFESSGLYWWNEGVVIYEWGLSLVDYHTTNLINEDKYDLEIKSVHQLQNYFYALRGYELQIKKPLSV